MLLAELMKLKHPPAQSFMECLRLSECDDPLTILRDNMLKTLDAMMNDPRYKEIHTIFIHNCEFVERQNPIFEPECRYAREIRTKLTEVFRHAQDNGKMRRDIKPEEAALIMHAFCFGIISTCLRNDPWLDSTTQPLNNKHALDVIFAGLRPEAEGKTLPL
jgi:hypothetical protein